MPRSAKKAKSTHAVAAQPIKSTEIVKSDAEEVNEKEVVKRKKQKIVNDSVAHAVEKEEGPKKPADMANNGVAAAETNVDSNNESESNEEDAKAASEVKAGEEENDNSEEPKTAKKDDADVEMVDTPSAKKMPQTPTNSQATGSNILFVGNLSILVDENDVKNFFKDAGEIVEVRFSRVNGRFAGYVHVEFATPDAAQKALELDGKILIDRDVKLHLAKGRGACTPSNGNERSSQKRKRRQRQTVNPQTPASSQAKGSQTLFVGDLSYAVEEKEAPVVEKPVKESNSGFEEEPKKPADVANNGAFAAETNVVLKDHSESNEENAKAASEVKAGEEEENSDSAEGDEPKTAKKDEEPKKPADVANNGAVAAETNVVFKDQSESKEENAKAASEVKAGEDEENIDSEEGDEPKTVKKDDADVEMVDVPSATKVPQTPTSSQATGSSTLYVGNLSSLVGENDVKNFFKDAGEIVGVRFPRKRGRSVLYVMVEFATPDAAQKALELNGKVLLDREVKLDFAKKRGAHTPSNGNERSSQKRKQSQGVTVNPQTSAASQATGSKTLFVGDLSSAVEVKDLINFFKDAGEVVEVRLAIKEGRLAGFGHVEFATSDAAQKALELNGKALLDCPVRLDLAKESGAHTPSIDNERSSQKSEQSQGVTINPQIPAVSQDIGSKTLFVGNLSFSVEEEDIINFFKDAGEVVKIRPANNKRRFGGYRIVEFATPDAAQKALELNGKALLDREVRLGFANERGAHTSSIDNKRSSQKSEQSQGLTVNPQTPASSQAAGSKTLLVGGPSNAVEEKEAPVVEKPVKESSSGVEEEPKKPADVANNGAVAAETNVDLNNESGSNEEDARAASEVKASEEEENRDSEEPKTAKNDDADMEMVDAPSTKKAPQIASSQATGSKTLFVGNLSFSVEEEDVISFFKDAGEVVEARFAMNDDRFAGYGHVEFATPDAAQKALELNGKVLLDREVKLDLAKERGALIPSNSNERSSQKSEQSQGPTVNAQLPTSSQATGSKTLFVGNLSYSVDEEDVINFFKDAGEVVEVRFAMKDHRFAGYGHVVFATPDAAQKALELNGKVLRDREVKLDIAKERVAHTLSNGNTGSKVLFVGNLSFSVDEEDVINFFKDAGQVVDVRFARKDDRFAGYGHVEFATPDAAQKALELNGKVLLDREVKLDLAKERGAHAPSNGNSSQKSGQYQIHVSGFGSNGGSDSVRSTLKEHFGQCGEISRMAIPMDSESGDFKGFAFIDFTDSKALNKALELSGSEVSGGTITVKGVRNRGGRGRGRGKSGR